MKNSKLILFVFSFLFQLFSLPALAEDWLNTEPGIKPTAAICPLSAQFDTSPANDNRTGLTFSEILLETEGAFLGQPGEVEPSGFEINTQKDLKGKYFAAIGPRAHTFVGDIIEKGALGLIVEQKHFLDHQKTITKISKKIPVIIVKDSEIALQRLARYWRQQLPATIIGISGSNGKTTTKEFTTTLLKQKYEHTQSTAGNYNNHVGVPLTLLSMKPSDQVGVIEMGMNNPGELEFLVQLARPDVVVVNTVGMAHAGNFKNAEEIARAKGELYRFAPPETTFIFNLDNPHTLKLFKEEHKKNPKRKTLLYSEKSMTLSSLMRLKSVDVSMKITSMDLDGVTIEGHINGQKGSAKVPVFGLHNLYNIMPSAALALTAGMTPKEIWNGLSQLETPDGRNEIMRFGMGAQVIYDGYNANPDSMKALIDNVAYVKTKHKKLAGRTVSGKKLAVFAEMLEMGELSVTAHETLGQQAAAAGLDHVWFYAANTEGHDPEELCNAFKRGFLSASNSKQQVHTQCGYSADTAQSITLNIAQEIEKVLHYNDIILLKGSRGRRVEDVLETLQSFK